MKECLIGPAVESCFTLEIHVINTSAFMSTFCIVLVFQRVYKAIFFSIYSFKFIHCFQQAY